MARARFKILFVAETQDCLCEKREVRRGVSVDTSMSDERFAAKQDVFMTERVF